MSGWHIDESMFPGISGSGKEMIQRLTANPHAPIFRNHSGHRLCAGDLHRAREFLEEEGSMPLWSANEPPVWLDGWIRETLPLVPFYRSRGDAAERFTSIAPVSRADLSRDIAAFVPDGIPVDRMILFSSSGTTGYPLTVPSHPLVAAGYLAFHKRALRRMGIELAAGRGVVSVMLVGFQKRCFTYASVNPLMDEAGLVKINLNPDEWKSPDDRSRYVDDLAPELITGDPVSLAELAKLQFKHRPRAIMSTSMTLTPALRSFLQSRFECPVADIYSMNESGPVASWSDTHNGFSVLQHRLYIEILSPDGSVLPPEERGEVTLTGGFNFYLPLIRYRTGDYASLRHTADGPVLIDFEGRPPVRFHSVKNEWINNIDITHALAGLALMQYSLHQKADTSLLLRLRDGDRHLENAAIRALEDILGNGIGITVLPINADDKVVQYTSELCQI